MTSKPSTALNSAVRRLGCALRLAVSAAALSAAVAGIPYALFLSVGSPWPDRVTSVDDLLDRLSQPVSDPFVLTLVALVAWVCWAYFMAVLARETLWVLRSLPQLLRDAGAVRRHTASLPAHRAAAAVLVATLLLALIGLWRPYTADADESDHRLPALRQVVAAAPVHASPVPPQTTTSRSTKAYVTYTVAPGDTLWDIAAAHLGDPLQWPKIYELSCAIRQSDGSLLSDPDLIMPGWELRLPLSKDASDTRRPAPPSQDSPKPSSPPALTAPPTAEATPPADHEPSQKEQTEEPGQSSARRPVAIGVGPASTIGITAAAGITAAIVLARRHASRRHEADLTAPLPEPKRDLGSAADRAHRAVLASRTTRHDTDAHLPRRPVPATPREPGAVTVAELRGCELDMDALALPGGVHLVGPGACDVARAIALAVGAAAQRLRPAPHAVRLITPAPTLDRLLPGAGGEFPKAWTVTDTPLAALETAEHFLLEHARHQQERLTAHAEGQGDPDNVPAMAVLLLDRADPDLKPRLAALAAQARSGRLAVLTLDAAPAQHALHIDVGGAVDTGPDSLADATLFTLAPEPAIELLTTLRAAHGKHPTASAARKTHATDVAHSTRTDAPIPTPPSPESDPAGPASRKESATSNGKHPVHIKLFGRFTLTVHGKECALADARKEETREYLSLLGAYPSGLNAEEIADKMNLAGNPEETKAKVANLRRSARRLLRTATGTHTPSFVILSGERQRLDPQLVATDLAAFTDAVREAASTTTPYAHADALRQIVETYDGQLCDGSDYMWLDDLRPSLHRRAVDALVLLADHMAQHSTDPEPALALLNQAADFDPTNERVYQRIVRLQRDVGRDDAAHRTLALLSHRLADIDAEPEPATTALLYGAVRPAASR
ncbi:LysM peptidoglycan-binding domain-containing protein [Streptomyces sp. TRM66268-LWL]|uniref:LysM peptidoglycan-binding domain-containing protein n=1 Tax=Streptomyces polyasparticus TaxID=2767826 RepID=A0ABR7SSZ6_9ACTN|nr:BTAD domain-containing putative transcriptional regulator [Streptomyces polyasparticus]MBC9718019.1 LysM peptidoglycan-binding domain-containing protein [Streptomyces polyasparticus]